MKNKLLLLLALCSSQNMLAGVVVGGGGLSVTTDPIQSGESELYEFNRKDFATIVTSSLLDKPVRLNGEAVRIKNLDFINKTIEARSLIDSRTVLFKEKPQVVDESVKEILKAE